MARPAGASSAIAVRSTGAAGPDRRTEHKLRAKLPLPCRAAHRAPNTASGGPFFAKRDRRWMLRLCRAPALQRVPGSGGGAAPDGQPLGDLGPGTQPPQVGLAAAQTAALVGAEGLDGLAGEVEALQEGEHRHGHGAPVVGVVKCSPSSPALENTGLNGLHKCVFCSFLVAYCSDLSHLLYSASPVYTNTYV